MILGVWADLGALLLVAFLAPVAFFMHAFWRETDEQTNANQMAHFMKNMARDRLLAGSRPGATQTSQ